MLVIPNAHASNLADMDEDSGAHIFKIAQRMAGALRKSGLKCEGVNLFLADGEAAFQDVFHVHLHVIPRYKGDGFKFEFSPSYYQLPSREELDHAAGQIRVML
jgi:diadenosine tetraphosphate (Ap4A) HIT family hydrolase